MAAAARPAAAFLVALLLSACVSRGTIHTMDFGLPTAGTPVTISVATTRKPSDDPDLVLSGLRSQTLHGLAARVSIPPVHQAGRIEWPGRTADSAEHFVTTGITRFGEGDGALRAHLAGRLSQRVEGERTVLVYVHGYNLNFPEALYRTAQMVHDARADAVPVLFSWPSAAATLDYAYDRESAALSRDALEATLGAAADAGAERIFLVAHSMGAWLAVESLRQMTIGRSAALPKLSGVMLAAPDIDFDLFSQQIARIQPVPQPFFVFVSSHDRALTLSALLAGGQRLGSAAGERPLAAAGVQVVDISRAESGLMGHGAYAGADDFLRLVREQQRAAQAARVPGTAATAAGP